MINKEKEIIDKYNNGISINKLSKEYKLNWRKIEKILIQNNVEKCKEFLDYIYQDANLKLERKYQKYIDWYSNN